ncbi:hypothetical protein KY334_02220 [Candidatus Woesearchaeota archaeon]|nr:hypothetical protein [Candidatus Woesearchaeota archaeon]
MKTFLWIILVTCVCAIVLNANRMINVGLNTMGIIGIIFVITNCLIVVDYLIKNGRKNYAKK